jgi:ABC-type transport system substrate-binding protein
VTIGESAHGASSGVRIEKEVEPTLTAPRFFGKTIAAVLIAVLAPFFVCQPAVAAHDRVRYDLGDDLTSLNPLLLNQFDSNLIAELAYEPLLRLGPDLRFVPALATQEPSTRNGGISPDGKRITFHLRPGTVWSDGTPVTASDVRFFIEQTLNPKNHIQTRAGFDQIAAMHVKGRANDRNRSQARGSGRLDNDRTNHSAAATSLGRK